MQFFRKNKTFLAVFVTAFVLALIRISQGSLAVKSAENSADNIHKSCAQRTPSESTQEKRLKISCYSNHIEQTAFTQGRDYTYDVLSLIQAKDNDAKNCHFIAHAIGNGLYRKNPTDLSKLVSESNTACGHGELMGLMEEYIAALNKNEIQKEDVINLCGRNPYKDCNHAVGHMMLVVSENNMSKAQDLCEGLLERQQLFMCYQGMIMERFVGEALRDHDIIKQTPEELSENLAEFIDFCKQQKDIMEQACWREIAHPAYTFYKGDINKIFEICSNAPSKESLRFCMNHSMQEFSGGVNYELSDLKQACEIGGEYDPTFRNSCYQLVISMRMNFIKSENFSELVMFCKDLDQENTQSCFRALGIGLKRLKVQDDKIIEICSTAPTAYHRHCMGERGSHQFVENYQPD